MVTSKCHWSTFCELRPFLSFQICAWQLKARCFHFCFVHNFGRNVILVPKVYVRDIWTWTQKRNLYSTLKMERKVWEHEKASKECFCCWAWTDSPFVVVESVSCVLVGSFCAAVFGFLFPVAFFSLRWTQQICTCQTPLANHIHLSCTKCCREASRLWRMPQARLNGTSTKENVTEILWDQNRSKTTELLFSFFSKL